MLLMEGDDAAPLDTNAWFGEDVLGSGEGLACAGPPAVTVGDSRHRDGLCREGVRMVPLGRGQGSGRG